MKNLNKKFSVGLALLLVFLFLPDLVCAKDSWYLFGDKNILSVEGDCSSQQVRVDLFSKNNADEPIYTSGAWCKEGKFDFSDDLLKWNLPDGEYTLEINGDKDTQKEIKIKREIQNENSSSGEGKVKIDVIQEEAPIDTQKENIQEDKKDSSETPEDDFSLAVENLSESVNNLNESIDAVEKTYPNDFSSDNSFGKMAISMLREITKSARYFLADLMGLKNSGKAAEEGGESQDIQENAGTEDSEEMFPKEVQEEKTTTIDSISEEALQIFE